MAGENILIVDDNEDNLKLTTLILRDEGYVVRTALEAEEAMSVLDRFQPRLILLDLQLPGVDGFELTQQLRRHPVWRDIIVVAHTAYAGKVDARRALDAGCDDYVSKPIDIDAFLAKIRDLLHSRERAS